MTVLGERPVRIGTALVPGMLAWRRLGAGYRCETWLAWSVAHGTPVVVKLPRPDQTEHPRARRALDREAAVLRAYPHSDLPRLLADERDAVVPHLVVEHVDGPALDELLDETGPAGDDTVLTLAARLLAPLGWLHRHGVVHLDVKPANVLVRDAHPLLIDLGSARPAGRPQPPGRPIGSPGYAAPELEAGDPITPGMDLYSLGVTLAEAHRGDAVFDPDTPAGLRPDPSFPDGAVGELLRALTARDPADRPPGCDAALDLVRSAADATGCPPVTPSFVHRTGGAR
jgi:eukaryotic-like serine/threonine-protein kinase